MAATGAAAKQAPWIARMWRHGWEKIPMIMVAHCVTTPIVIWFIGSRLLYGRPHIPAEKYRMYFTVIRPGDPRIARITHESSFDKVGFLE